MHLRPELLTREAASSEAVESTKAAKEKAEPVAPAAASVMSWYDRGIRLTPLQP